MKIKLIIANIPQSYNKVVKFSGWQRQAYRDEWYEEVNAAFLVWRNSLPKQCFHSRVKFQNIFPYKKAKVTFTIYFPDKTHRDKINLAGGLKFALDALTVRGVGIIQDDQWYPEKLVDDYYVAKYDKKYPRTEIEIEEIK